jgi:hypothetical protein
LTHSNIGTSFQCKIVLGSVCFGGGSLPTQTRFWRFLVCLGKKQTQFCYRESWIKREFCGSWNSKLSRQENVILKFFITGIFFNIHKFFNFLPENSFFSSFHNCTSPHLQYFFCERFLHHFLRFCESSISLLFNSTNFMQISLLMVNWCLLDEFIAYFHSIYTWCMSNLWETKLVATWRSEGESEFLSIFLCFDYLQQILLLSFFHFVLV